MKKLCCLVFLFISSQLMAAQPLDDLNRLLAQFKTMQANFTEVVKSEKGRVLQTASGKLFVKRPGQFRWNRKKPSEQFIVVRGRRVWIYDPDLEQVTERSLSSSIDDAPAKLLTGDSEAIERAFLVSRLPSHYTKKRFRLISKIQNSMTPEITLIFTGKNLSGMEFQDALGQITAIKFSRVVFNRSIKPAVFHLDLPKGVDIIRE